MDTHEILMKLKNGELSVEEAERHLRRQPFEELGYAKIDTHRKLRSGFPEVVFCSGKADEHLLEIFGKIYEMEGEVFGTRACPESSKLRIRGKKNRDVLPYVPQELQTLQWRKKLPRQRNTLALM